MDPNGLEEKIINGKLYESRVHSDPKSLVSQPLFLNSAGRAECVEIVKQTVGENQRTTTWREGESVTKDTPVGTAIGNFNSEGKFDTKDTGQHAALLLEPTKSGGSIKVVDQWDKMREEGKPIQERTILTESPNNPTPSNNAKDFHVILFEKKEEKKQ